MPWRNEKFAMHILAFHQELFCNCKYRRSCRTPLSRLRKVRCVTLKLKFVSGWKWKYWFTWLCLVDSYYRFRLFEYPTDSSVDPAPKCTKFVYMRDIGLTLFFLEDSIHWPPYFLAMTISFFFQRFYHYFYHRILNTRQININIRNDL